MAWWTEQRLHPKAKSKFVVVFGTSFFIPSVKTVSKPKVDFDTKEYKLLNHKFNYPGNATWQPIELKFVDMNGLGDTDDTFDTSAFLWQVLNNTGYAYPYLDDSSNTSNNPYYNNVVDQKVGANGGHHIATKLSYVQDDPNTTTNERLTTFRTITTPEKSSTIANSFGKGLDGDIDNKAAHYSRQKITIYQLSPEGADADGNGAKIVECWHLVNPIVKSIGWGDLSYDSDELVEYSLNIVYDWAIYDRKAIGTVVLPIPGAITDQNVAEWGDGRINPLQLAGLEVAGEALSKGIGAAGQSASDLIGKLGNTSEQAKKALAGVISAAAVGISADEVLARTQGAVVNPNLELLFKGPSLRPFNFSFQMGARNEQESLEIMKILRFFKQGGSPQRTSAQYLVKAPHTFQIEYLHRGEDGDQNKFLNKIKECALLSVGVNYTPNNNYATFKNGAPVAVELSLAFKELDPVFNDEYGDGDGDVGF